MENRRYDYKKLESLTVRIFQKLGFPQEQSESIANVLITSDLFGVTSHGLQRLNMYFNNLKFGRIKIDAEPKIVRETPVSAVIDAVDSMGQVAGVLSMDLAIRKARTVGIGFVVTRNNNHFGIAGYYSRRAMQQGFLGVCLTNSSALQVPTNGKQAMLGSNPIAVAMPAEPFPFMLDLATAVIPAGKLEVYKKDEKPIPVGWAVGLDGKACTDPAAVLECFSKLTPGGILPLGGLGEILGGHKGYGISLLVELFTAVSPRGIRATWSRKSLQFTGIAPPLLRSITAYSGIKKPSKRVFLTTSKRSALPTKPTVESGSIRTARKRSSEAGNAKPPELKSRKRRSRKSSRSAKNSGLNTKAIS